MNKYINNLSLISSVGKNNELGKNNKLIWRFSEDMKFFKEKTMNKPIVMGYNTFLSLPKILPGRHHVVLTSKNIEIPNVEVYNDINSLLDFINNYKNEVMIIGGEKIYREFIELCFKMYLTEIDDECVDADSFFPIYDDNLWNKKELGSHEEENIMGSHEEKNIKYKHLVYTRKRD